MAFRAISTGSSPMFRQSSAIANRYFSTRNTINALLQHLIRPPPPPVPTISTPSRGLFSFEKVNLGLKIVPKMMAFVIERNGKYFKTLTPGVHFLNPLVDRIAFVHCLREIAFTIPDQLAITKDKVRIVTFGAFSLKIVDPKMVSYVVQNPVLNIIQHAQTTIRDEFGKITFDKIPEEYDILNEKILESINEAAKDYGLICLRCLVRKNHPFEDEDESDIS